jgi:hypothetical protein
MCEEQSNHIMQSVREVRELLGVRDSRQDLAGYVLETSLSLQPARFGPRRAEEIAEKNHSYSNSR